MQNTGKDAICDVTIQLATGAVYICKKATQYVAMLVPQVVRKVAFDLICENLERTDTVRAYLMTPVSQVPLIVAAVNMPMSEQRLVDN